MTGEFPTQRASNAEDVPIWWRHHGMKIIWWNGPQDIEATKSSRKVRRPTVPWKGRNESPLIDIHSSIKAIHQSVIDIMDIHNSNMDVYNPVMYIHNTITDIQTCRNSYGYPWLILGCPVVDHLTIITRIDNIGKLYGQRLTYLHNLQGGYCMQNYIKPQSRKKYRRNSDFYNSWSTCHPTWRRVRWSISTAHARISREKSFCINYDNYV